MWACSIKRYQSNHTASNIREKFFNMDSVMLNSKLQPFFKRCAEKGRPIEQYTFDEAYPGDPTTSYIINVKASWFDTLSCYEILKFLFEILWETAEVETRIKVFAFKIFNSKMDLRKKQLQTIYEEPFYPNY